MTDMSDLVSQIAAQLPPHADLPFAFFGHSLGALIAFELARELRRSRSALPVHLFVSGRRAPHLIPSRRPLHALPEAAFRAEIRELQGTPQAVLEDEELMTLVSPVLRADFGLCETYRFTEEAPLDTPITAFGGTRDEEASEAELDDWRLHTSRFRGVHRFDGHHFFVHDHAPAIIETIRADLSAATLSP
jgi:medium-chain acyl-[acyl-carrier-protein] hydrolase